jgi:hypothetical protein
MRWCYLRMSSRRTASASGDALCHRDDPGELLERPVAIEKVDALGSVTDGACDNLAVRQLVGSVIVRLRSALHDDAIARSGERVGNVPRGPVDDQHTVRGLQELFGIRHGSAVDRPIR